VEENNRKAVQAKREVAADSLQTIKLKILDIQNEADTVGELGPLQYLSGLTGAPMDKIINILLLVIIFVFDPLAISMVIAANFAFDMANPKRPEDEETPYEPTLTDDFEDEDEDDYYDNRGSVYYDDNYDDSGWTDGTADQPAESKPPFDVSIDKEAAQGWYDIADEIAKNSKDLPDEARGFAPPELDEDEILEEEFGHLANEGLDDLPWEQDPEVQAFLEAQDEPGPWSEEDDKIHTVGGLTNDKESGFMDFQKKQDENDAIGIQDPYDISVDRHEPEDFEEELEAWKNRKWEVENTAGDIEVIDPEEVSNVDETETEADRVGTFPNENNPTSVAATVEKIKNEFGTYPEEIEKKVVQTSIKPTLPTEEPVVTEEESSEVDEDELFDAAMRKKAEQDMKDFLNKNNDKQN
jgi:hypothetical protein